MPRTLNRKSFTGQPPSGKIEGCRNCLRCRVQVGKATGTQAGPLLGRFGKQGCEFFDRSVIPRNPPTQPHGTRKHNHTVEGRRIAAFCVLGLKVRNRTFRTEGLATIDHEPVTVPDVLDHFQTRQSHPASRALQLQSPFARIDQSVEAVALFDLILELAEALKRLVRG